MSPSCTACPPGTPPPGAPWPLPQPRAFMRMADAAREDGITLYSVSAYRSYSYQDSLYRRYTAQDGVEADTYSPGRASLSTRPAWPWTSIPPAAVPISRPPRPTAGS